MDIKVIEDFAKPYYTTKLPNDSPDKGLWDHHIQLVRKFTVKLAEIEGVDKFIAEASALLHDIGKYKGREGHPQRGYELAKKFLDKQNLEEDKKKIILLCVLKHSRRFSKEGLGLEVKIIQSADALGVLFDEVWQEHSRKTLDKKTLLSLIDKSYDKINLESAKRIAKPQVEKLKSLL